MITSFTGKVAREKRAQIEKSIAASMVLPLSFGCLAFVFLHCSEKNAKMPSVQEKCFHCAVIRRSFAGSLIGFPLLSIRTIVTLALNKRSFSPQISCCKIQRTGDPSKTSVWTRKLSSIRAGDKYSADKFRTKQIEQEKKKEDERRAALSQEERDTEDDKENTSMEDDAIKQAEDDDKKQADLGAEQDKVVKLKAAKAALAKAEESGDAAAIEKAKKAITDIEAKENWQLDGTRLGGMLNARVSKINSDAVLAESKYQSQSIAERLRRLL